MQASGTAWDRDVHDRGRAPTDVPERRSVGVGEDRAPATRKDGRQPMPLPPELAMPEREDAAMKPTKAMGAKPFLDSRSAYARRKDL